jgi:hypothetical protein
LDQKRPNVSLIGENDHQANGKAGFAADTGPPLPRPEPDYRGAEREGVLRMRVMIITWLTLIAAGLVFYSVIGLTHH